MRASAGVAERYPPDLQDLLLSDPTDAMAVADSLQVWRRHAETYRVPLASLSQQLRAYTWDKMAAHIVTCIEHAA